MQENEATKNLSDNQVVQLQGQMMQQQDQQLDKLMNVIQRQKEIGITISNELGESPVCVRNYHR